MNILVFYFDAPFVNNCTKYNMSELFLNVIALCTSIVYYLLHSVICFDNIVHILDIAYTPSSTSFNHPTESFFHLYLYEVFLSKQESKANKLIPITQVKINHQYLCVFVESGKITSRYVFKYVRGSFIKIHIFFHLFFQIL